ncbi:MAPEG family protein [Amylibacter sp. IMCC11727]|uniref:MAPEG family protein n=1 Tax=Amylibacter sp. IMCC11727 TaxID=3039851 RepID=UPI00244DC45E|nr:MAPEG family protein [Amylibacter sp. IMCC11727]WGI20553.1 MAPEG family protein [Amylibacter sp. IMCC11727]
MDLQITALSAAVLAIVFLVLTFGVIKARTAAGISILHGDDMSLALKMRVHGNFAEFVPLALILMALAENAGGNKTALSVAAMILVISRIILPFGLKVENMTHPVRIAGNIGTHLAMLICVVLIGLTQFA